LVDRGPLHLAQLTRRCRLGLERLEEPPGDARGQQALQRALWRQVIDQR
jgi:hypothetical protein